ncbi:MAG TPA: hypothetical protein VD790_11000 [Thermoleophilaceae bacterium]|nr:hypothetical protein [Thermoleophilaceae bacterium]
MVKQLLQRQVLLGPAALRRAAAARVERPEEAWMLRQPRPVRRTYAAQVLDAPGDEDLLAEIWMLRQPETVRESYIEEVLRPAVDGRDGR